MILAYELLMIFIKNGGKILGMGYADGEQRWLKYSMDCADRHYTHYAYKDNIDTILDVFK